MFEVKVKTSAAKFLLRAPKGYRERILAALDHLKTNPIPYKTYDITKLEGYESAFRLRIGKIRVVYEIFYPQSIIEVHDIDFRGGVY